MALVAPVVIGPDAGAGVAVVYTWDGTPGGWNIRPATYLAFGGTTPAQGNVDILWEWAQDAAFTVGLIQILQPNQAVTADTRNLPPNADLGPPGTRWFARVQVTDLFDLQVAPGKLDLFDKRHLLLI